MRFSLSPSIFFSPFLTFFIYSTSSFDQLQTAAWPKHTRERHVIAGPSVTLAVVSFDWLQRTVIWETGVEEAHLVKKKQKNRLCRLLYVFKEWSVFLGIYQEGVQTDRKSHHNNRCIVLARLPLNQTGVTL